MEKKSKVKRFSKIYYGDRSKKKNPIFLIFLYSFVFCFVAVLSYLTAMGINSYFNRPHCTKIEPLPSEVESEKTEVGTSDDKKNVAEGENGSNSQKAGDNEAKNPAVNDDKAGVNAGLQINGVEVDLKTLNSKLAFEKFIEKAKADKKNAIVVCLKGDDGRLRYESELELAHKWKTLPTKKVVDYEEIVKKIKNENLIPIARMSAFYDQTAPSVENENTFVCENSSGGGVNVNVFSGGGGFKKGKWLDITKNSVRKYVTGLALEMTKLGFEHILIDNAWFPVFKSKYELENFENEVYDENMRFKAISKFFDELNSSGVSSIISYPGNVFFDSDISNSLFGKLSVLKKVKIHAPIFLNEAGVKKCETSLIELASSLVFVPELYSNTKKINNLLNKFDSYEINSNLIVR